MAFIPIRNLQYQRNAVLIYIDYYKTKRRLRGNFYASFGVTIGE